MATAKQDPKKAPEAPKAPQAPTTGVAASEPAKEKKTRRAPSYLGVVAIEGRNEVVQAAKLPDFINAVAALEAKGGSYVAGTRGMPLVRKAKVTFGA
jgi:hypothetical protein